MALKFADTAEAMGDFPIARADGIEITKKDDTKKSLQSMYDDGELGGGEGLPLPEQANMVMITYEKEDGNLDWKQSLIKTVEKVDEMPTTFEDKIYVKNGTSEAQVYASDVELATKEYVDEHGGGGGSSKLTEQITSNVTVGGIETNTTYAKGTNIEEVIKNLLVKYLPPTITTSISPSTSPLYVGDTVAKVTISATVTKQSKPITSVKFYAAGVMVHETTTGVADGGTFTFDYEPATAISATTSFYATVTDGTDTVNGTTRTITFVNPSYFGTVAATVTTPTATDIKGLTKMKQTTKGYTNNSITMAYGKILYVYPKSYGALTSIKDANNVQYISSYTRTEVTVDGVAMYCYLLTDAAGVNNFTQIYA